MTDEASFYVKTAMADLSDVEWCISQAASRVEPTSYAFELLEVCRRNLSIVKTKLDVIDQITE